MLSRFGILNLALIDYDVFSESNLNRQRFSNERNLGELKVLVTKKELLKINSSLKIKTYNEKINKENYINLLKNHDLIFDCLDNVETRFILNDAVNELKIPMVHGAIGGFFGQVSFVNPGDNTIFKIYKDIKETADKKLGNPSFTPLNIASIQVSEALKYFTKKGEILNNKLLYIDLLFNDFTIINLD